MIMGERKRIRIKILCVLLYYGLGFLLLFFQIARVRSFPAIWKAPVIITFLVALLLYLVSLIFLFFLNNLGRLSLIISAIFFILCTGLFQFAHTFEKVLMTGYWKINRSFFIIDVLSCLWISFILYAALRASFSRYYARRTLNFILFISIAGFIASVLEFTVSSSLGNPFYYLAYSVSLVTSPTLIFPIVPIHLLTKLSIKSHFLPLRTGPDGKKKYYYKTVWDFLEHYN